MAAEGRICHRLGAVDKAGSQDVDFVRELEQIENLRVVGVNREPEP
jgi:hypothetical protein